MVTGPLGPRYERTTPDAIIALLREISVDGIAPSTSQTPSWLKSAATRRFGSYGAAVRAAGLRPASIPGRPPHPDGTPAPAECIEAAQTLAQAVAIAVRNGISSGERVLQIARALREMRVSA